MFQASLLSFQWSQVRQRPSWLKASSELYEIFIKTIDKTSTTSTLGTGGLVMEKVFKTRSSSSFLLSILATASLVACSTGAPSDGVSFGTGMRKDVQPDQSLINSYSEGDAKFFGTFALAGATEAEYYEQLEVAVEQATATVLAQVTDIRITRALGSKDEGRVEYVGLTLKPVEILSGTLPKQDRESLTVEFVGSVASISALKSQLPEGYGLWLLRNKAEAPPGMKIDPAAVSEEDYYRLVSSQGLFIQGPKGVINPLVVDPGPDADPTANELERFFEDPVTKQAEGFKNLTGLADQLRS